MTLRELVPVLGDYSTIRIVDFYLNDTVYFTGPSIRIKANMAAFKHMLGWRVDSVCIEHGVLSAWACVYVDASEEEKE